MEGDFEDYLYTPKCFENDLNKILKYANGEKTKKRKLIATVDSLSKNRIFEIENRHSFAYMVKIILNNR